MAYRAIRKKIHELPESNILVVWTPDHVDFEDSVNWRTTVLKQKVYNFKIGGKRKCYKNATHRIKQNLDNYEKT